MSRFMAFTCNSVPRLKPPSLLLLLETKTTRYLPWRHFSCLKRSRILSITQEDRKTQQQNALRIVNLITHRTKPNASHSSHLRFIDRLLQPNSFDNNINNDILQLDDLDELMTSLSAFIETSSEDIDAEDLTLALTSCGSTRNLRAGGHYHCAAITRGFIANMYIGTCLVSLYSKCKELDDARRVFDEMPVRNVVSWSAIISGFAQECLVDICFELFHRMRLSDSTPNTFTFTSLLRACFGSGALEQGRSVHSQAIRNGFQCYVHVSNALVSMYGKCGTLGDALRVFRTMDSKDTVSWNSMIAGYALHGLASRAINLFEEMKRGDIEANAITFLAILSSCRHAGLVQEGLFYFNSMLEYGMEPELDHYSCVVDLLGRAGLLEEARHAITNMPVPANAVIWSSMLSSSRLHENVWFGIEAAEKRLVLEPSCAATHLQLANLYASIGRWDRAARVRKVMRDKGMKIGSGYSWIEVKNVVHRFRAEDKSSAKMVDITLILDSLMNHMTLMSLDYYDTEVLTI